MAGYARYSMSNNAVVAYNSGEKPISKWNKKVILESIKELEPTFNFKLFSKLKLQQLKNFLICSSWHHTAKFYNKTDFYSIDEEKILELTDEKINLLLSEKPAKTEKQEPKIQKAIVKYLVWGGTRKHPTATEKQEIAEIKGNWSYLPNGSKKSLTSNGTEIIKYI